MKQKAVMVIHFALECLCIISVLCKATRASIRTNRLDGHSVIAATKCQMGTLPNLVGAIRIEGTLGKETHSFPLTSAQSERMKYDTFNGK